ncbi:MAG: SDR family NAD(P)-dependent oxidoreductase [Chloroflexi bacterium]|nr:MAG: SDR family NAD(P)-dependent oxidoreductase [Chloroflexota bacterium]
MATPDLNGKRILVLGAETELGAAIAAELADAGARLAVVAGSTAPDAAFAAQRLARRLSTPERPVIAQAVDATNEMGVRVMVRQASKAMGGLDAVVFSADLGDASEDAFFLALRWAGAEMFKRSGGPAIWADISLAPDDSRAGSAVPAPGAPPTAESRPRPNVTAHLVGAADRPFDETAGAVITLIEQAAPSSSE